ncbi:UDP-glucose 4-epimerase GalE [Candidatus Daviesbacteria bacterium]|nr:UDP-glucose 4-epimerase GalE [Candidatus Daviesbacteria bacterium]
MKILIAGGAGFIGNHISKLLLDQGHEVLIFDNLSRSDTKYLSPKALFIKGDINDNNLLEKCLKGIDWVIHLAQFLDVEESVQAPQLYLQNNVLGTFNLLECMKKAGVGKIVFSSSACVYGNPRKLPLLENVVLAPANPYGACKVAVEALLSSFHSQQGFDVVILRYFNPFGPMENHIPETHVIPKFIKAALLKKPMPLYWKGKQVRDFIYIEDLARAHTDVFELKGYQVFNIGTEKGVKIADIVKILSDILGYKLEVDDLGQRAGDVMANYASSAKFKKATGWKPRYTLKEGLAKTIDWFKENS